MLESRKHLFPVWTLKRILSEAVDMPSQYWLEPDVSFNLQNTQDWQLDLPISPKAFRFHSLMKIVNVPTTDSGAYQLRFSFYLKHMKLEYETWSANKITDVKVNGPHETDSFPNAKFKVARGKVKLFNEEPIVYNSEYEELYEHEMKRRN
ncbi:unnamed protein product [Lactuca virosa]|uniref:Uncharacterized protein n=1 Tax=Lactuca virosa TaxID=75947 RepID=A0AAU9PHR9_9ASTR|nr:unnamed protein product [Lactuca virosa]